jgi:hypothetical protein
MASALNVKEHILVAQDENASQEDLLLIWNTSRSVKVRKTVASNPNAGAKILRAAARLYLEEVLGNPGFAMLELFDDDEWIKKLSLAYSDPNKYIIESGGLFYSNRLHSNDHLCWAMLLSPKLSCWAMNRIVECMSAAAFRRAIKNTKLKSKLNLLYETEATVATQAWPFSLATLLTLSKESMITNEQLYVGLSNYGTGSTSAQKSIFRKFVGSLHEMYRDSEDGAQASFVAKLLAKLLLVSRSHTLHWIYLSESDLFNWGGELYAQVLSFMEHSVGSKKALVSDNIRTVGIMVSTYIRKKFLAQAPTPIKVTRAYEFIKAYNLMGTKFSQFGLMLNSKNGIKAVSGCPMEVKDFFCRGGCLGNWASASGSDTRYLIINEVNEHAYLTSGLSNLLFDKCSVRKIVVLDDNIHVV